jgi:hypothetical protein
MKWLIAILILAIALIAGCTQTVSNIGAQAGIGVTNIGDIVKNPEIYENKTVEVVGTLGFGGAYGITDYVIKYSDEQGYHYELNLNSYKEEHRVISTLGEKYKIKGILRSLDTCICQNRYVANITEEEWEKMASNASISIDYKKNVKTFSGAPSLFLPTTEEGWCDGGYSLFGSCIESAQSKTKVLECKDSVFSTSEIYTKLYVNINSTNSLQFHVDAIINEKRCKPNSTEKFYYLEGTEPMIKIS